MPDESPPFRLRVQQEVEKTELTYEGPAESLEQVKQACSGFDSSDIYPSFDDGAGHSLFFHTVADEDVEQIRAAARQYLQPVESGQTPESGDTARSPFRPAIVGALLIVALASAFTYHWVIADSDVESTQRMASLKQSMVEASNNSGTETTAPAGESPTREEQIGDRDGSTGDRDAGEEDDGDERELTQAQRKAQAAADRYFEQAESSSGQFPQPLEVHFLDVGQGDASYIRTPDGRHILVDAGYARYGERIVRYLRERNVSRLDAVIMSHPHADHIGGIRTVLEQLEVAEVWDAGTAHTSKTYEQTLEMIKEKSIPYRIRYRGERVAWGDYCDVELYHPEEGANYRDLNNVSVSFRLDCSGVSVLFTGDAEQEIESEWVAESILRPVDVLQAGHHGSKSSSTKPFLQKLRPDYAVISSGRGNSYGHPSPRVLQNFKQMSVETYRTDQQGTIVMEGEPGSIRFRTETGQGTRTLADASGASNESESPSAEKININEAGADQLTRFSGVGPATATKIVRYRSRNGNFQSFRELENVSGIGSATRQKIEARGRLW